MVIERCGGALSAKGRARGRSGWCSCRRNRALRAKLKVPLAGQGETSGHHRVAPRRLMLDVTSF